MDYRNNARLHHGAAKKELASGDDARLIYAALELRMSMEAITYDRALAFKDEFPPDEYQTWQPRKVMSVLLEIDQSADADRALAMGAEEHGVAAPIMQSLGVERVLNLAALKKHYDALGSFLHIPSMKQSLEGKTVDNGRLRKRCEELEMLIGEVLSSPIFNVTLGDFATTTCFRCETLIRKRLRGAEEVTAECFGCHATYSLTPTNDGQILWRPQGREVHCAADGCDGMVHLWDSDLQVGKHWKCAICGGRNALVLGIVHEPS